MAQNTKNQSNEANEAVGQVVSKAELFLEANKKKINFLYGCTNETAYAKLVCKLMK